MLRIDSREYKMMLDQRVFRDWKTAAADFCDEVTEFTAAFDVRTRGRFKEDKTRTIEFLDTSGLALYANGYVLRQRSKKENGGSEFTLKCRAADRYIAAGADVRPGKGYKCEPKFEEDIAPPFLSRYSLSSTLKSKQKRPKRLKEAIRLFPVLQSVQRDGSRCDPDIELSVVNGVKAFERVLTGPTFDLGDERADLALILWSNGSKGRPLVAEFSFRYERKGEGFSAPVAQRAHDLFIALQRLDWVHPQAMTKTQYVYRTGSAGTAGV
jgi:hypothetical protein